jgi:phosphoribosylamine-glycine ligase
MGLYGYEAKDLAYLAKPISIVDVPEPLAEVLDAVEPWMLRNGMQGIMSTEVRITDNLEPDWIDACMRFGSPPTELQCVMWKNFAEAIEAVAKGEQIDLKPAEDALYGAQVVLKSDWAATETTYVEFPDKFSDRLKFRNICKVKGDLLYIPKDKDPVIGSAVGIGRTREEAEAHAIEAAESVIADGIHFDRGAFDTLDDTIEKARKIGLGDF